MKVLQVGKFYPPHWGGMETAVRDISQMLAPEVDVEVLVANASRSRLTELHDGVPVTRLPNWKTLFSQPLTPALWRELNERRVDIVHLHEPNPLAMVLFLASRNPARLIVHYHSDIVRQRALAKIYRPVLERGLARAEAIIVGSPQLRDSSPVLRRWRDKCVVVPFGIDLRPFLAVPVSRVQRSSPQILAVGRLSYYKGFHHLVRAAQTLDARVIIAGAGECEGALRELIASLGLENRVELTGRVTQQRLMALYQESDIFCLPSCEPAEAFGLAMVEGMAAGLPLVSTDLPTGVRLVNQDGVTGLVARPADPASLAHCLGMLAASPDLRLRMGLEGRRRAQELFAREQMGRAILELYRSLDLPGQEAEEVHGPAVAEGVVSR